MSLSKNFIIPVKNKEEWNKVILILYYYDFVIDTPYEELIYDFPYIRYEVNRNKILTSGSSLRNFKKYSNNHDVFSVKYIMENF